MSTVLSQDLTHSTPGTVSQDSESLSTKYSFSISPFSGLQAKSDTKVLVLRKSRDSIQAMATCMLALSKTLRRMS